MGRPGNYLVGRDDGRGTVLTGLAGPRRAQRYEPHLTTARINRRHLPASPPTDAPPLRPRDPRPQPDEPGARTRRSPRPRAHALSAPTAPPAKGRVCFAACARRPSQAGRAFRGSETAEVVTSRPSATLRARARRNRARVRTRARWSSRPAGRARAPWRAGVRRTRPGSPPKKRRRDVDGCNERLRRQTMQGPALFSPIKARQGIPAPGASQLAACPKCPLTSDATSRIAHWPGGSSGGSTPHSTSGASESDACSEPCEPPPTCAAPPQSTNS
jgi:hypothetical protein